MDPAGEYVHYLTRFPVNLPDRTWINTHTTHAPEWCSVDLRDGNQALESPMSVAQKLRFYQMLLDVGFQQIEIGYPAASKADREFARALIEDRKIPVDVKPQVLVAAREDLIQETFSAMKGAPETIIHVYNSTSKLQREVVYEMSKDETMRRAVEATRLVRQLSARSGVQVQYQYSPESFTGTELEFARDVCNEVIKAWQPTSDNKIIINLPATVEMSSPDIYADQIEYMCRSLAERDNVIVSIHPHNDRGESVSAAQFALRAGANRVEGTLFGNGERAGNVDIVVLALNLFTQGINPMLDFSDLPRVRQVYEECTGLKIPDRHPYAGDAAPIAYSGTHQVAIRKTLAAQKNSGSKLWDVAYLPINFSRVGREYNPIVVNSQSGKNGSAFVLESQFGIEIPKKMESEVGRVVQKWCDERGTKISPDTIKDLFTREFVHRDGLLALRGFSQHHAETKAKDIAIELGVEIHGKRFDVEGRGNGPIDASVDALRGIGQNVEVKSLHTHSLGEGSGAQAIAYVEVEREGVVCFGVGIDTNTELAQIKALFSGVNRAVIKEELLVQKSASGSEDAVSN